jgi:hypothetical protein
VGYADPAAQAHHRARSRAYSPTRTYSHTYICGANGDLRTNKHPATYHYSVAILTHLHPNSNRTCRHSNATAPHAYPHGDQTTCAYRYPNARPR